MLGGGGRGVWEGAGCWWVVGDGVGAGDATCWLEKQEAALWVLARGVNRSLSQQKSRGVRLRLKEKLWGR